MLSHAVSIFFIKLSVGILPWLTLVYPKDTGKTFFRILAFVSLASSILGLLSHFLWYEASPLIGYIFMLLIFFSVINRLKGDRLDIWILPVFLVGCVVLGVQDLEGLEGSSFYLFMNQMLASLLMGAGLVAMVMGHWYLIRSKLSFHYLKQFTLIFLALVILRMFFILYTLYFGNPGHVHSIVHHVGGFLFFTRFLWGGVLPIIFIFFAYGCARIHSNRSATGILYFTTSSLFMGELLADFISVISGIPI